MRLPTPAELGMPDHITAWRPRQEDGFAALAASTKRVKAICAPTGSGKSDLAVGSALLHPNEPTCIVTDSRALQDQYLKRYASIGMVDIRGRANYDCLARPDDPTYTCEQGFAARCPYKGQVHCPASQAEMRAASSRLVITNYSKWIHARKFSQGLSHIKRLVFDEAHEMPNALAAAMQVILHSREIEETLGLDFPNHNEAHFFSTWRPWAAEARANCEAQMVAARSRLGEANIKAAYVKHYTHLRHLSRRLAILATASVENWVVEELPRGYQFDPIQPARYAESALLLKVPDILCMSATLRPKTLYMSGIAKANFDFTEFLSDFDPTRCPIYYTPTMRVDQKAPNLALLWLKLDQIAGRRRDRNGLVHTISYTRRDEVLSQSRYATSMFINEKGEPPTQMIEQFVDTYPGSILVSPSVGQGFDFPFKAAEWQFICKVPFPPPSKVLQARTEKDPEVPYYLATQKLVQMAGRLMRDQADQGETFIGDDHLVWFLKQYGHLAPKSFNQFFKRVETLPSPPPRLG